MTTSNLTPLGFSDLNEDEAFVVWLFRDWQKMGNNHLLVETQLRTKLINHRFFNGLQTLFCIFKCLPQHSSYQRHHSALLDASEVKLLDLISNKNDEENTHLIDLKNFFKSAEIDTRPISEIPRSGHDELIEIINQKTAHVFRTLHPV